MHLVINKSKGSKKIYTSILLRESYREGGKVKKRTIANLSNCKPEEIKAIALALKYKGDLSVLGSLSESVNLKEGLSIGAVWTVYHVARQLGIEEALLGEFAGKLALWQVIARVIEQGSRLSAVRLAQSHAACEVLGITRGFDENDLYDNLRWLADNKERIEDNLFLARRGNGKPELFLYDVTSSYLEGDKNYFGRYGYNRDGKKGKKQIVIGLLCDEFGEPVSTEVFAGNTGDSQTFSSQVNKVAQRFGCNRVTFVGDRGMIKSCQIESLPEGFHYITAITKPEVKSLIRAGVFQIGLFDDKLCEVEDRGVRYILRRNPIRVKEINEIRLSKRKVIEELIEKKNAYLRGHSGAKVEVAIKEIKEKLKKLKIDQWLDVKEEGRLLRLEQNDEVLQKETLLDGCYVIKTDLPGEVAGKEVIHDRYKDLAEVEKAFRDCKSVLEVRPVFVRSKQSTEGHVFVVMLAYMIMRRLRRAWEGFDLTVQEGIKQLSTLCSIEIDVKGEGSCLKIPRPRMESEKLMKSLGVRIPSVLPKRQGNVVTRKKLFKERKTL